MNQFGFVCQGPTNGSGSLYGSYASIVGWDRMQVFEDLNETLMRFWNKESVARHLGFVL